MATHSSVLAWRIPGMGEPGGLPSMGSHRVRHHWSGLAAGAAGYPKVLIWLNILLSSLWPKSAFPKRSQSCKVRNQMILSLTPWICVLSLIIRLLKDNCLSKSITNNTVIKNTVHNLYSLSVSEYSLSNIG